MRHKLLTGCLFTIAGFLTFFLGHRWWERLNQPTVLCPGCNVIIIDIDTFRADAFDCKGKPGDSGYPPNLCEFVKDAFKFENNIAPANWTLPSMVSTHTGLYPPEHGIFYSDNTLSRNISTMPEVFQDNGYQTFRIGFMGKTFTISKQSETDRGYKIFFEVGLEHWPVLIKKVMYSGNPSFLFFYFGELLAPYLLDESNPLAYTIGREPYFPITSHEINEDLSKFLSVNYKGNVSLDKIWDKIYKPFIYSSYQKAIDKNILSAKEIKSAYEADINEWDRDFMKFLNNLAQLKESGNSVIVFMSDHGEAFYEHGYLQHVTSPGAQYNELLRVPLYIFIPGIKGKTIAQISSNIDIFPTIFEIVGADSSMIKNEIHGKSLVPVMIGNRPWEKFQERVAISFSRSLGSIQNSKYKMIFDLLDDDLVEIYDLINDKGEKNNIARNSQFTQKYFVGKLESVFNFRLKGLGVNWKDRFSE